MDEASTAEKFRRAMGTLYDMFIAHRGYDRLNQLVDIPQAFLITKEADPDASVLVYLRASEKLNIDGVKEMMNMLQKMNLRHGVLVYQNSITSSAKKALELLYQYRIELFAVAELQYNITKHMYFCPHEKVRHPSEIGHLQNQLAKLPKILSSDPVVRFFGFSKNDILRIRRPNGVIAYRIVR